MEAAEKRETTEDMAPAKEKEPRENQGRGVKDAGPESAIKRFLASISRLPDKISIHLSRISSSAGGLADATEMGHTSEQENGWQRPKRKWIVAARDLLLRVSLSLLAASSHRPRERKLWNWKIILKSRDALRRNFICRLMRSAHLIYCVVFIRQFIGFFFY